MSLILQIITVLTSMARSTDPLALEQTCPDRSEASDLVGILLHHILCDVVRFPPSPLQLQFSPCKVSTQVVHGSEPVKKE